MNAGIGSSWNRRKSCAYVTEVLKKSALTVVMVAIAVLLLFPIVVTFTNSLMTDQEMGINYGPIGQINKSADRERKSFCEFKIAAGSSDLEAVWQGVDGQS